MTDETAFPESPLCREPGCHRQRGHTDYGSPFLHRNLFTGVTWPVNVGMVYEDTTTGTVQRGRR